MAHQSEGKTGAWVGLTGGVSLAVVLALGAGVLCIKMWRAQSPPPPAIAPDAVIAAKAVTVPIDLSTGHPVVQVLINGHGPYRFLLDTGCAETHVSHALAQGLDLPPTGSKGTFRNAVGKEIEYAGVLIDSIQLGEATFPSRNVLSRSFESAQRNGDSDDGILGYHLFDGCLVTLDFPAGQLVIQKGRLAAADGRDVLAFVHEQSPTVEVSFGDMKVNTLIDTGCTGSFMLPTEIAGRMAPLRPPRQRWSKLAGEEGVRAAQVMRMKESVRIGAQVIAEPIVDSRPDYPAVVGMDVLRHFAVTLDVGNRRVRIARQVTGPIRVPGARTIGLTIGVRSGAQGAVATIDGIDPQGPASGLDVRIGDHVLMAGGRPFNDLDDKVFRSFLTTRGIIDLELERDGERFTRSVPVVELP
jgi:predicted aspartyl protease